MQVRFMSISCMGVATVIVGLGEQLRLGTLSKDKNDLLTEWHAQNGWHA